MFPLLIVSGLVGCAVGMIEGKANGKRIFRESLANVTKKELISWEMEGKSVLIRKSMSNPQYPSNSKNSYTDSLNYLKNL